MTSATDNDPTPNRVRTVGHAINHLADLNGSVFDAAASTRYTPDQAKALNDLIIATAKRVLTTNQFTVFTAYYVDHLTETQIATTITHTSRDAVNQSLHGKTSKDGYWRTKDTTITKPISLATTTTHGGSLSKVQKAMKDPQIVKEVQAIEDMTTADPVNDYRNDILNWYKKVRQPNIASTQYVPLTVLLVIYAAMDSRNQLGINDLHLYLPVTAINAALTTLRILGYIAFDGITITLKRTPLTNLTATP